MKNKCYFMQIEKNSIKKFHCQYDKSTIVFCKKNPKTSLYVLMINGYNINLSRCIH